MKRFTDPTCCPPELCDPGCQYNTDDKDKDCGPTDPPTKCTWGYKLGDLVAELIVEPIQKQIIDDTGMVTFFKCFNEYVEEHQTLELECFKNSLGANYKLLTSAMKNILADKMANFDNVDYVVDGENKKKIQMDNQLTQKFDNQVAAA